MSPDYAQPFDDSLGDASGVSPYTAEQLSLFLKDIGDFVIVESLTSTVSPLDLYAPGANGVVGIRAGAALVKGALYELDADTTKAVDAAANNRIDLIVLRFDSANHTVRLTTIKGVAAANPAPPNITVNDFRLGWYWVPSGYNPATTAIPDTDIHDDRVFWNTGEGAKRHNFGNLLHNSEFLAYSLPASGVNAPEGWRRTAVAPDTVQSVALLSVQPRGNSINIALTAGATTRGIQTQVRVSKGWYTLRGSLNVTSGYCAVRLRSASGTDAIKYFRRTGAVQEFTVRGYTGTAEELEIYLEGIPVPTDVTFGQLLLAQGFITGYFRHQHEIIMLDNALTDANWTATPMSTGATLVDLSASFGSQFGATKPIRGVILRLEANDSGNIGSISTSLDGVNGLSTLLIDGVGADKKRDALVFAPMIGGLGYTFYLNVVASGANTLDATAEIIGIIT